MPYTKSIMLVAGLALATAIWVTVIADDNSGSIAAGKAFVTANCANCHAIGADDASPLPDAPALRDLHRLYPIESLAEAFAEGIVTGHEGMPEFELDTGQIDGLIAYLDSFRSSAVR